ncbi:uncharacterized protein TNIN_414651 [Trichonephila inaurata madagascariensis]|uniref:Uncharacterized protein n=1 Tax=Trichonephila inaurata madagascariensis TaxID=2747483 RepID=A0A8X6JUK7_9ARAC|nr:uncharacterized protein TNIN_414651 [Trichonephila inaurata madagascariensis]
MIFGEPVVPTLEQMSFVVIAIRISNDPEVESLMKKYGPLSFAFPDKELRTFLNKKIPESNHQMMYKGRISEIKHIFNSSWPMPLCNRDYAILSPYSNFNINGFTTSDLPSKLWEEIVSKKISCLPLPNIIKSQLMSIIRCICLEIDRWKKDHRDNFELDFLNLQNYICWTSQGKIDRVRTAKSLINDENLPISKRFNLARHYCFVEDVISLLKKMNKVDKSDSLRLGARPWFGYRTNRNNKNSFHIRQNVYGINPLNLNAFFSLLVSTHKVRWCNSLINLKLIEYEDLRLHLSLFKKNEQENTLRQYSSKILQYYLVWPLQNEFLIVSKNIWPYMSIENYIDILHFIIYQRIMIGWKDVDYVGLLKEFWSQTPNNFKELVKKEKIYQVLLPVIRCELFKRFPNEVILENYTDDVLHFHHIGIHYEIKRLEIMDPVESPQFQNNGIVRFSKD